MYKVLTRPRLYTAYAIMLAGDNGFLSTRGVVGLPVRKFLSLDGGFACKVEI